MWSYIINLFILNCSIIYKLATAYTVCISLLLIRPLNCGGNRTNQKLKQTQGEHANSTSHISAIQKPVSTINLNQYVSGSVYTCIPWLLHIWITTLQKMVKDIKIDNRMIDFYARAVASITPFSQKWEEIVSSLLNIHTLSKGLRLTHNVLMIND